MIYDIITSLFIFLCGFLMFLSKKHIIHIIIGIELMISASIYNIITSSYNYPIINYNGHTIVLLIMSIKIIDIIIIILMMIYIINNYEYKHYNNLIFSKKKYKIYDN
ncbi:MAG: NADH-quinone oxidoreductase subunit K [Bacteroides sp.]|nr:MAG: NADH-quinone oxidoreductase subunit K [Bacteroides sp.]